jgi:hypothetical protein
VTDRPDAPRRTVRAVDTVLDGGTEHDGPGVREVDSKRLVPWHRNGRDARVVEHLERSLEFDLPVVSLIDIRRGVGAANSIDRSVDPTDQ